jgi:membrane protein
MQSKICAVASAALPIWVLACGCSFRLRFSLRLSSQVASERRCVMSRAEGASADGASAAMHIPSRRLAQLTGLVTALGLALLAWPRRGTRATPKQSPLLPAPSPTLRAPKAASAEGDEPTPQPERTEPRVADPGLTDLSRRDWIAIFQRAAKESLDDNVPMIASALAYSSFFAIPAVLLVAVGLFSLLTGPETISDLIDRFSTFMPGDAAQLLGDSLQRLDDKPSTGIVMTLVGFLIAIWTTTSAMSTYMAALNTAYDRKDGRGFAKKRAVALLMAATMGAAVLLVALFLIFGRYVERFVGDALGIEAAMSWLWWIAQWPLLAGGLLIAFATLLYLAPDVEHRRWQFVTPGALVALVVWLVVSGGFALYTGLFSSYNKTWGSLSAVIVTLTWLWLTALALLFGGELNSEVERSRELRRGEGGGSSIAAPTRSP